MCAESPKPSLLSAAAKMKCPNCRKGDAFANKSVFPLNKALQLVVYCEVCGQKMVNETNNGPGINYAFTVVLFFLNYLWYWPIFGISVMDDSIYYFMAVSTIVVLALQPWMMRYARIVYLYFSVPYQSNRRLRKP